MGIHPNREDEKNPSGFFNCMSRRAFGSSPVSSPMRFDIPKSVRVSECYPMEIPLNKCNFRIFLRSQLNAMSAAAPEETPRGRLMPGCLFENTGLSRRTLEES
jgi:hypothetical protein